MGPKFLHLSDKEVGGKRAGNPCEMVLSVEMNKHMTGVNTFEDPDTEHTSYSWSIRMVSKSFIQGCSLDFHISYTSRTGI